jgi:hypothetical protein
MTLNNMNKLPKNYVDPSKKEILRRKTNPPACLTNYVEKGWIHNIWPNEDA